MAFHIRTLRACVACWFWIISATCLANPTADDSIATAVYVGDVDTVRDYVDAGGDVDARNKWGDSLLMTAIDNSRIDVARILVNAGAEIGDVELNHALGRGEDEIFGFFFPYLETQPPDALNKFLVDASGLAYEGYLDIVTRLIAMGADPDVEIDGDYFFEVPHCRRSSVHSAMMAMENEYAVDAESILKRLVATIGETTGENEKEVIGRYSNDTQRFDCRVYD